MNRLFISAIFILTSLTVAIGQEWGDTCEEAIETADENFENGIMEATSYGLIIAADWDFEDFYDKYLLNKYNIKASNGGCVVTEHEECYSSRMFELIRQKFGEDFFKIAKKEAEALYPYEIKDFEDDFPEEEFPNVSSQCESLDVYLVVDVWPEFSGGIDSLFKYVNKKISEVQLPQAHGEGKSYVAFVIDSTGRPNNVEIIKGYNAKFDSTLVEILLEMPKWKSGIKNDKKVNVKMALPFNY